MAGDLAGDLDGVWKALSDPTRRAILDLLRQGVTPDKIVDKLLEVIPAKEAGLEKDQALPKVTGA